MSAPSSPRSRGHIPTGTSFHKLTVVQRATSDTAGRAVFLCRCECGNECLVRGADLRSGHTKSCGCRRSAVVRQRLGRIQMQQFATVLPLGQDAEEHECPIRPSTKWLVVCRVCNHRCFIATTKQIRIGSVRCVCLTPTHTSWRQMIQRCTNKKHHEYHRYGGKGIQICKQWRRSFVTFFQDMGPRPKGKTIDRYPNRDGNYEPGNCRWATPGEQAANRSKPFSEQESC